MKFEEFNTRGSEPARGKGRRVRAAREAWQEWKDADCEHNRDYEASVRHELGIEFSAAHEWFLAEINASPQFAGRGEPLDFFRARNGKWPPLLFAFSLGSASHPPSGSWAGLASSAALGRALDAVCSARSPQAALAEGPQDSRIQTTGAQGFAALAKLRANDSCDSQSGGRAQLDASTRALIRRASPFMAMLALDELCSQTQKSIESRLRAMGFESGFPEPAGAAQQPKENWPHRSLWMPFHGRVWNVGALSAAGLSASQIAAKWGEACRLGAENVLGPFAHWVSFNRSDANTGSAPWVQESARAVFGDPLVKKERQELLRAVLAGQSARKGSASEAPDAEKPEKACLAPLARRGRRI